MATRTLNIALPEELIQEIDKTAKREYRNRSELIREALFRYLKDLQEWEGIFALGRKKARTLGVKSEKDIDRIVYQYRHGKKKAKGGAGY